jgi:hypothetical protein
MGVAAATFFLGGAYFVMAALSAVMFLVVSLLLR